MRKRFPLYDRDRYWVDFFSIDLFQQALCLACICSQIVTGAATVFFPDFVSSAAVIQGKVFK